MDEIEQNEEIEQAEEVVDEISVEFDDDAPDDEPEGAEEVEVEVEVEDEADGAEEAEEAEESSEEKPKEAVESDDDAPITIKKSELKAMFSEAIAEAGGRSPALRRGIDSGSPELNTILADERDANAKLIRVREQAKVLDEEGETSRAMAKWNRVEVLEEQLEELGKKKTGVVRSIHAAAERRENRGVRETWYGAVIKAVPGLAPFKRALMDIYDEAEDGNDIVSGLNALESDEEKIVAVRRYAKDNGFVIEDSRAPKKLIVSGRGVAGEGAGGRGSAAAAGEKKVVITQKVFAEYERAGWTKQELEVAVKEGRIKLEGRKE